MTRLELARFIVREATLMGHNRPSLKRAGYKGITVQNLLHRGGLDRDGRPYPDPDLAHLRQIARGWIQSRNQDPNNTIYPGMKRLKRWERPDAPVDMSNPNARRMAKVGHALHRAKSAHHWNSGSTSTRRFRKWIKAKNRFKSRVDSPRTRRAHYRQTGQRFRNPVVGYSKAHARYMIPKHMRDRRNPLSCRMDVGQIMHELKHHGSRRRPQKQMVAIALSTRRRCKLKSRSRRRR